MESGPQRVQRWGTERKPSNVLQVFKKKSVDEERMMERTMHTLDETDTGGNRTFYMQNMLLTCSHGAPAI